MHTNTNPTAPFWNLSQLTMTGDVDESCGCTWYSWHDTDLLVHSADCASVPGRTWFSDPKLAELLQLSTGSDGTADTADLMGAVMYIVGPARVHA
ncbi:hypothetical protein [Tsukamurella pseudospumae]|uniref:Uncharacterized protein n=1 Tax=Tsukamurella pseudospumae TaxID=239498 RepID=A0A138AEE8_9ACTN|nr:hypothetical protein [Tsukamurella pseudospumae]KXP08790.1 hypothetical protein AXK60_08990 [Tsukamurella pseudospumae]